MAPPIEHRGYNRNGDVMPAVIFPTLSKGGQGGFSHRHVPFFPSDIHLLFLGMPAASGRTSGRKLSLFVMLDRHHRVSSFSFLQISPRGRGMTVSPRHNPTVFTGVSWNLTGRARSSVEPGALSPEAGPVPTGGAGKGNMDIGMCKIYPATCNASEINSICCRSAVILKDSGM
jgi:hypothetical protein